MAIDIFQEHVSMKNPHVWYQNWYFTTGFHLSIHNGHMSCVMRKPNFCKCENKDTDQLRDNPEADQRLCFRYTDSTIPLLFKSEIQASSHLLSLYSLVCVGPGRKPRRPVFLQRCSYHLVSSHVCQSTLSE